MSATLTNTVTDSSTTSVSHPALNFTKSLTNGIAASQANRSWQSKNRTIASGAQEIIDLASGMPDIGCGVGKDAVGQTLTLEEIVAIAIVNENAVTSSGVLTIEPSASEGWEAIGEHTVANAGALRGQGVLFKCQIADPGFALEGNKHRITLKASGDSVTYSIYVLGRDDTDESSSSSLSSSSSSSQSSLSISTSSVSTSSSSISTSSSSASSLSESSTSESSSSLSSP
jgi:hypothetical protein